MLQRLIALLLAGVAVAACGDAAATSPSPPAEIDEQAGTALGVGLGDSTRELGRLGPRRSASSPTPEGLGLPWVIAPPAGASGIRAHSYRDTLVLTARPAGVYTVSVWRPGVRTRGGIRVGDPLSTARERYPGLRCGIRNEDSEYVEYPYCTGRVGDHFVWFGEDPIKSVTISSTRLG